MILSDWRRFFLSSLLSPSLARTKKKTSRISSLVSLVKAFSTSSTKPLEDFFNNCSAAAKRILGSLDCNCSFPMVEDKTLRTELLILGLRRFKDLRSTCFSLSAFRPLSPDSLRIIRIPSSLILSRLPFKASRAGRAAGFPWLPSSLNAFFIFVRLLFPKSFKVSSKSFAYTIENESKPITKKTKMVIINSPNNPSGVVYNENVLSSIWKIIQEKEKLFDTHIYLVSDEPYRKILFDNLRYPHVFPHHIRTIITTSHSKDLALKESCIVF